MSILKYLFIHPLPFRRCYFNTASKFLFITKSLTEPYNFGDYTVPMLNHHHIPLVGVEYLRV
jgi:hypothetical protein